MNKTLSQFLKNLGKISLSQKEKNDIGNRLFSYIKTRPIHDLSATNNFYQFLNNFNPFNTGLKFSRKSVVITLSVALIISLGITSTVFASNQALPGDALYGVKIKVFEEARGLFATSSQKKAEWETVRASRRMQEVTRLALDKRLTKNNIKEAQELFNSHIEKISEITQEFRQNGQNGIALNIQAGVQAELDAQTEILSAVAKSENAVPETQDFISVAQAAEEAVKTETTDTIIAAVQGDSADLEQIAESEQSQAEKNAPAVYSRLSALTEGAAIANELNSALKIKYEGSKRLNNNSAQEAVPLFQESKIRIKKTGIIGSAIEKDRRIERSIALSQPQPSIHIPVEKAQKETPIAGLSTVTDQKTAQSTVDLSAQEQITPQSSQTIFNAPSRQDESSPVSERAITTSRAEEEKVRFNAAPKIIAYPSVPLMIYNNDALFFNFEAYDPDDDALRWTIFWGDGDKTDQLRFCRVVQCTRYIAEHKWIGAGAFTVEVQVSDQKGGVDRYSFAINVLQQAINSTTSSAESSPVAEPQTQPENQVIQTENERLRNDETPSRMRKR